MQARYDSALSFLADRLNRLHGVRRSKTYWHLVVGPWLFYYVNLLCHHYHSLRKARAKLGWAPTIALPALVAEMVAHDLKAVGGG